MRMIHLVRNFRILKIETVFYDETEENKTQGVLPDPGQLNTSCI